MRLLAAFALLVLAATPARAADPRVVVDPDAAPWDVVARVQSNIGTRCTGVLVAPAEVLTAAHCLYNPRTRAMLEPVSLHLLFGYQRDRYRWHRLVARYETGPGFDGRERRVQAADWALLYLRGGVPVKPAPLYAGGIRAGLAVMLAGYNQDRAQLLLADLACHVLAVATLPGGSRLLAHDCAATLGTSGAPLLARQEGHWAVVGINIAAGRRDNLALAPPPEERALLHPSPGESRDPSARRRRS